MTEVQLYEDHKRIYSKFYEKIIKNHGSRSTLARKFNAFIAGLGKIGGEGQKMYLKTVEPKRGAMLQVGDEMQSLRVTTSSSKNALEVSRSKYSRRSDSSRGDKSQGQSRFFGVDWVFSSANSSRVFVFAILASFILNENSVGFFMLEDRINQHLTENSESIPPILMISINKYWQRIVEIVTKKKSYLWEKHLKEPIDCMPLEFNKLIARIVIGRDVGETGGFTNEQIGRLSKQGKINLVSFVINYREIEKVQREGGYSNDIIIGYLKHSKNYVIANKIPQYNESEQRHRKVKAMIQFDVAGLLREYKRDEEDIDLMGDSTPNEKQKVVRQFFNKKLALLKPA